MTDEQIISDWLTNPINESKITTLLLSKQVYNFVEQTCDCIDMYYKIGNSWHKIKQRNESSTNEGSSL